MHVFSSSDIAKTFMLLCLKCYVDKEDNLMYYAYLNVYDLCALLTLVFMIYVIYLYLYLCLLESSRVISCLGKLSYEIGVCIEVYHSFVESLVSVSVESSMMEY